MICRAANIPTCTLLVVLEIIRWMLLPLLMHYSCTEAERYHRMLECSIVRNSLKKFDERFSLDKWFFKIFKIEENYEALFGPWNFVSHASEVKLTPVYGTTSRVFETRSLGFYPITYWTCKYDLRTVILAVCCCTRLPITNYGTAQET